MGRSTFYENFRGKNGILTSSISSPFAVLASSIRSDADPEDLVGLLDHFWAQRASARGLLCGPVRNKTAAVLIAEVERVIRSQLPATPSRRGSQSRVVAIQIAEVLLAPITAWLLDEIRCTSRTLALALVRAARAILAAQFTQPPGAPPDRSSRRPATQIA